MLVPVKTIITPYNERLPDRKTPNRERKKRNPGMPSPHHLQQEPVGERIDLTA